MDYIDLITKALGYTENGGRPNLDSPSAGKTGELASVFQFEPGIWKNYSHEVFGKDVPMNPDTETMVVGSKVKQWYDEDTKNGFTPDEAAKRIASRWNAGAGEPDAYTGKFNDGSPSQGVNKKYGVAYSVPEYVGKFTKFLDEFKGQGDPNQQAPVAMNKAPTPELPQRNPHDFGPQQPVKSFNGAGEVVEQPQQNNGEMPNGLLAKLVANRTKTAMLQKARL